nr:MAG TPA: hypothetical protein [Caudoviricetes sp.]
MHCLCSHKVLRFHCAHLWLQLSACVDCFGHFNAPSKTKIASELSKLFAMLIYHVAIEYNTTIFFLLFFIFHLHHLFVVGVVTIRWRSIYVNMMGKINKQ